MRSGSFRQDKDGYLRTEAGLVVETGAAREVHQFATLAGYGAEAINPYLAFETLAAIREHHPDIVRMMLTGYTEMNVAVEAINRGEIYRLIAEEGVTHLCGAPILMSTLLAAGPDEKRELDRRISFFTAAAPPPESVLAAMKEAGFDAVQLHGGHGFRAEGFR